jgi:hypothetical protein
MALPFEQRALINPETTGRLGKMSHKSDSNLPLVVQLGFTGSRYFVPADRRGKVDEVAFNKEVMEYLFERLSELPTVLGLSERSFICGVCQLAIGGDTFFVQACQRLGIPVRIFLPEPPDVFFEMEDDVPDFAPAQKEQGKAILESPDVIQLRVIGEALIRDARFQQVNHEMARVSDLIVCLVRKDAKWNPGGSLAMLERARVRQRTVLKITVGEEHGHPTFTPEWIDKEHFVAPHPPELLAHAEPSTAPPLPIKPSIDAFVTRLREESRVWADRFRNRFTFFATTIIGTHVVATLLALFALGLPHEFVGLPWLLGVELSLLLVGFGVHWWMHHSHVIQNWSNQRLIEQIASSVDAVGENHVPLDHFFNLPLPDDFRSLMRTLNVLHLSSTRRVTSAWEARRDTYVKERVDDQAAYYQRTSGRAEKQLKFFHYAFMFFSFIAILATGTKLGLWVLERPGATAHNSASTGDEHSEHAEETPHHDAHSSDLTTKTLGSIAVFLPVLAVAAMSIAAAHDLEGRIHTYNDIESFLERQRKALLAASCEGDFVRLLTETESRLLGETANWFSRRSFTGVA